MTLWSGRFDSTPDPDAFDFGVSFGFDRALFEDDVTGSLAWAEALAAAGVLSGVDAEAIRRGLQEILEAGRRDPAFVDGPDEDVHSFVERQLVERIGDAGRRLHTGRSRNEQVSVDMRLYLRRRIPLLQQAVARLVAACADQAATAGVTMMPAYTHLRRAQPVLVAHFFLSHAAALRRDHARLGAAAEEADALPLGSGAIAGTSYPTGWLATMKGLPSGYNKDLQEDKEAVFGAEATLAASLTATRAVLARLSLNAARTERAASGLLLATDVADYLVTRGMAFRRAHEVVGAMVRRLLAAGRDFSDLTADEWRAASEVFGDDAPEAATALASVRSRRTPQSTNPEAVQSALDECRTWLAGLPAR